MWYWLLGHQLYLKSNEFKTDIICYSWFAWVVIWFSGILIKVFCIWKIEKLNYSDDLFHAVWLMYCILEQKTAGGVLLPKSAVKFERYLLGEVSRLRYLWFSAEERLAFFFFLIILCFVTFFIYVSDSFRWCWGWRSRGWKEGKYLAVMNQAYILCSWIYRYDIIVPTIL